MLFELRLPTVTVSSSAGTGEGIRNQPGEKGNIGPAGLNLRRLEGVSAHLLRAGAFCRILRLLSLQPKDLPQESARVPCATIHPKGLRFPALKRKQQLVWTFDFALGL